MKIDYAALLNRKPIKGKMREIARFIKGKTILVTGGGGSIGSELCRQIAARKPKRLIIFDIYENNAFAIQQELLDTYKDLDLVVLIGSVRDTRRINQVFATYRPDVTYHAAAHKHVPLMEDSAAEAIKNNAIGTYKTAYAAMAYGCKRFVLVSTDKAVNPTNIMGASKRICEMIIQSFDAKIKNGTAHTIPPLHVHHEDPSGTMRGMDMPIVNPVTEFVAVRFGNVLGSNGSVVPTFLEQIANGGPVKVTSLKITRYFMLIPEAVSLVLQAGVYAEGGEIFVFNMGKPVRIVDMARKLIVMCGKSLDEIKIEVMGLRPGEKEFEETLMQGELEKTKHRVIFVGKTLEFDYDTFLNGMQELMALAYGYTGEDDAENNKAIRDQVKTMVKTYKPQQDQVDKANNEPTKKGKRKNTSENEERILVNV